MDFLKPLETLFMTYGSQFLKVDSSYDLYIYAGVALAIVIVASYLTFYTLKKIVVNLVLSYVCLYLAEMFFHVSIVPDTIMLVLMAFFGPIAVVLGVLWHLYGS